MAKKRNLTDLQDLLHEAGVLTEEGEEVLSPKSKKRSEEKKFDPIERSMERGKPRRKTQPKKAPVWEPEKEETKKPEEKPSLRETMITESSFPLHRGRGLTKKTEAILGFTDRYLEARLSIVPVEGDPIDRFFMERFLLYRGVKFGIDWDAIEGAIERANRLEVVQDELVAVGEPPVEGRDSYINIYFEKDSMHKRIHKVVQDTSVDHRVMHRINMVSRGQVIAEKVPTIIGEDGKNVRGEIIFARRSRDYPLSAGKNTTMNEKGELFAMEDGRPVIDEYGRVSVIQSYTVDGDVDINVGNIEFNGDIEILGSVRAGYSVHAGGSIRVRESVEAATLVAEEDITLKGGYTGGSKGIIQAGGNANLAHVNTGNLEVVGNVKVSKELINVKAFICGNLSFPGSKGSIRGGTLFVQKDLEVFDLGSKLGVPTVVHVGPYEICKRRLRAVHSELREISGKLDVLDEALEKLSSGDVDARLSRKKLALAREKLETTISSLESEKHELHIESEELELRMEKYHSCFVRVQGSIFPGVKIYIGKNELSITKKMTCVEFYLNPGSKEIKNRPYRARSKKESTS